MEVREALSPDRKRERYQRIRTQLEGLFPRSRDPVARMATAAALLHAKMPGFLWTGWYTLRDGALTVGPYQGPLACLVLPGRRGVCWAGVEENRSIVVPDVHAFPGHVACDSRSRSEIVVPLRDARGTAIGVLDIDSERPAWFDEVDREELEALVALLVPVEGSAGG